jgi:hypothetical protein
MKRKLDRKAMIHVLTQNAVFFCGGAGSTALNNEIFS